MVTETEQQCGKNDSIQSDHENPIINDIIQIIVKKEGFENYNVDIKFHSLDGEGLLGTTCEINIRGTKNETEQEINLFVKIMNEIVSTFLDGTSIYDRESFVYRDISKIYENLQNEFNVPEEERYKMVKSYSEFPSTVLVFENMNKMGFKTEHRSKIASLDFAELAVKEIAKFHALSIVLKHKEPEYFERYITPLRHAIIYNEDWLNYIANSIGNASKYVNDGIKEKLKIFETTFTEKYKIYMEDTNAKLCLCHGDFRPSNILIKEIDGKITKMILIDYQGAHYGCPVLDLLYFIFLALDKNMRRNVPHLKDTYYRTLESFLVYFNINIQDVFSREKFESIYNEKLGYGLQMSLLLVPMLMVPDGNITDLDALAKDTYMPEKHCQERMIDIFNDFIEWGCL